MSKPVPPTHLSDHPDVLFAGKQFYVIDDQNRVWGAGLGWREAETCKDKVAGNGWSRTPAVKPMPDDPKRRARLLELAKVSPAAAAAGTPTPVTPVEAPVAALASAPAQAAAEEDAPAGDLSADDLDDLLGSDELQ